MFKTTVKWINILKKTEPRSDDLVVVGFGGKEDSTTFTWWPRYSEIATIIKLLSYIYGIDKVLRKLDIPPSTEEVRED